jgi:serine/threonine protein kinase
MSHSRDDNDDVASDTYIAPENLLGCSKRTKEADVWSLGWLLAHVLLNKAVFYCQDQSALLKIVYKVVGTPARGNYKACVKYPNYAQPPKKYKLQHLLRREAHRCR